MCGFNVLETDLVLNFNVTSFLKHHFKLLFNNGEHSFCYKKHAKG